eukprot:Nitzschia sp. Nitz4//scaffold274_size25273//2133//2978//NITZ4_008322-RA/size25273-processed-gene-0.6-mRNA-1//1//CDS//3329545266//6797//frame0
MSSSENILVKNGETTLNVVIYRMPSSPTVVLLHGGPGVPDEMLPVVSLLSSKYQVINFQQRGTGESHNPTKDYSVESYISDLEAIATFFGLSTFHLFGHSFGGLYAQFYADAHPERIESLFLCSPSSGTNKDWETTEEEVLAFNQASTTSWDFLMMGWYSLWGYLGYDSSYQRLFAIVLKAYHKGHGDIEVDVSKLASVKAEPINGTRPHLVQYRMLPPMPKPSFPIMLAYGDSDIYGPSKSKVYERYPTATTKEIEACGHIPWFHNPTAFDEIMKSFYEL